MSNYRVTYFFEGVQRSNVGASASLGWTESWYWQTNLTIDKAIEDQVIDDYLNYRVGILGDKYHCNFVRVSDDDNPRRFKIANKNSYGMAGSSSAGKPGVAQVQCAVLVDLEKLPANNQPKEKVHHRRFLIRGLPVDIIEGNVLNNTSMYWESLIRFLNFIARHQAGTVFVEAGRTFSPFGIRYLDPTVDKSTVLRMVPAALNDKTAELDAQPQIVFVRGQKVVVSGIDSPDEFNRTWTMVGTKGAENTLILGTHKEKLQGTYTGPANGKAYVPKWLYGPCDQYAIIGLRNRKTGRVFRQLRGRSSGG